MKSLFYGLFAVAGLTIAANAGTSRLNIQLSKDGINWSSFATVNHMTGDSSRVLVRYSMSWIPSASDSVVPIGLANFTFQPTFANVRESDLLAPFAVSGTNMNGGGIDLDDNPLDGPFGRLRPFAASGPAATNAPSLGNRYMVHTYFSNFGSGPAERFYRIARNDITRWIGMGPTTGTVAINNFNGMGGLSITQKGSSFVTPNDPAFNGSINNVVIMQLAIDVGVVGPEGYHAIVLDAPIFGVGGINATTGLREASWFLNPSDSFGQIKGVVTVATAQIDIIPGPGTLAFLWLGGFAEGRRRRDHTKDVGLSSRGPTAGEASKKHCQ